MPPGQTFGLQAKVEPEVSRGAKREVTREMEEAISDAETIDGGLVDRTSVDGIGDGADEMARGGAAAAGGLIGGGLSSGAKMIGTVALGGVVASQMLSAMMDASAKLQATTSMFGTAVDLFFQPFGRALADTVLPFAEAGLDMAQRFNKISNQQSLAVGLASLSSDVESSWAGAVGDQIEGGLETIGVDLDVGGQVSNFLKNVNWVEVLTKGSAALPKALGEAAATSVTNWLANNLPDVGDLWPGWPDIDAEWPGWPDIDRLWPGWPDVDGLWPGWPDIDGSWPGWPNITGTWPGWPNVMGSWPGWPTQELNSFQWPDIGTPDIPDWSGLQPDLPDWSDLSPFGNNGNNQENQQDQELPSVGPGTPAEDLPGSGGGGGGSGGGGGGSGIGGGTPGRNPNPPEDGNGDGGDSGGGDDGGDSGGGPGQQPGSRNPGLNDPNDGGGGFVGLQSGGFVSDEGVAMLHEGEQVVPEAQVERRGRVQADVDAAAIARAVREAMQPFRDELAEIRRAINSLAQSMDGEQSVDMTTEVLLQTNKRRLGKTVKDERNRDFETIPTK